MPKKAIVVLAPGFEEIEAVAPIDVLRRLGVMVNIVSLGDLLVNGAHGINIQADRKIAEIDFIPDALIFPGGMPGSANIGQSLVARELAEKVLAANKTLAAICAAPVYTLAAWGMLNGKRFTAFPGACENLPLGLISTRESVTIDKAIITADGAGSALAFAFAVGEALTDYISVSELQKSMLWLTPGDSA